MDLEVSKMSRTPQNRVLTTTPLEAYLLTTTPLETHLLTTTTLETHLLTTTPPL